MSKKKFSQPLVSIITPCYNMGKYLHSCIESVLTQDYPYVEHIIQDAASTDRTIDILKRYSSRRYRKRIDWISEPDHGQADGLNKALQRAKGDILLVLNADDILLPYACSWANVHFALYPSMAVIYGDVFIINDKGEIKKTAHGGEYDFHKLFCVELVPPAQAAFIKRSYFEKVGFRADKNLDTCPDFEMWTRIGLRFPMMHIPEVISKYRAYDHLDSHDSRSAERFYHAKKLVIDRILDNPKTPHSIKKLRKRAYTGLSLWAAHEAMGLKNFPQGARYYFQALRSGPSRHTATIVMRVFLDSPLTFLRTFLNHYEF